VLPRCAPSPPAVTGVLTGKVRFPLAASLWLMVEYDNVLRNLCKSSDNVLRNLCKSSANRLTIYYHRHMKP